MEVKRPGNKPRALQMRRKAQLGRRGFRAEVVDSYEAVDRLLSSLGRTPPRWESEANPLRQEGYKLCEESTNPLRKEDGADPGGEGNNEETPSC